jgi:hypothetical protein
MAVELGKVRCTMCEAIMNMEQLDRVTDPHPLVGQEPEQWLVCPRCRTPENFVHLCDEPGCKITATCGWTDPRIEMYRRTCSVHMTTKLKGL